MSGNLIIEVQGKIDDSTISEISEHKLHVATEKFLSGNEIVTVVLVPLLSVISEKVIAGIIERISITKNKFTIKYNGKTYKNLSADGAKKIITSIKKGYTPD